MNVDHWSVDIPDIILSRYHPPSPDKLTVAGKDIAFFNKLGSDEGIAGLKEMSAVLLKASGMGGVPNDDEQTYKDLSLRARNLAEDSLPNLVYKTSH